MFTWKLDDESEEWGNDSFDTFDQCCENALDYASEHKMVLDHILIGEIEYFSPRVDGEYILNHIMDDADWDFGDTAADWKAYDSDKWDEVIELENELSKVVNNWLDKHGRTPNFYLINKVEKIYFRKGK